MDWIISLSLLFLLLVILLATNLPVAFAFGIVNVIALLFLFDGMSGMSFVIQSAYSSIANFSLTAVPFFLLMGSLFLRSGLSKLIIDVFEKLLSGVRASASYVTVFGGALFGALMGVSVASTAILGSGLIQEMRGRGYSKSLALGPILGSGTLANLIPPSVGMVLIGSLAGISIGDLLIAGLSPALLMVLFFCAYIFLVSKRQIRPVDIDRSASTVPLWERLKSLLSLLPIVVPIFFVTGTIFLGIATPTESAVTGAAGTILVIMLYNKMTWKIFCESVIETVKTSSMVFLIIAGSKAYSQILSILGVSQGFENMVGGLDVPVYVILLSILFFVLVLGCFMDQVSVIFVGLPVVIGVIDALSLDPVWFGVLFAIAVGIGGISPPFGLNLFVLKGVSPPDISTKDIYAASIPYVLIEIAVLISALFIPWLIFY